MSRTAHKSKGPGYDYWKRRLHFSTMCGYGSDIKRSTSRLHRRTARNQINAGNLAGAEETNLRSRGMTST